MNVHRKKTDYSHDIPMDIQSATDFSSFSIKPGLCLKACYVINAAPEMDYLTLGDIYKGRHGPQCDHPRLSDEEVGLVFVT